MVAHGLYFVEFSVDSNYSNLLYDNGIGFQLSAYGL
jgi:hypothetical protein